MQLTDTCFFFCTWPLFTKQTFLCTCYPPFVSTWQAILLKINYSSGWHIAVIATFRCFFVWGNRGRMRRLRWITSTNPAFSDIYRHTAWICNHRDTEICFDFFFNFASPTIESIESTIIQFQLWVSNNRFFTSLKVGNKFGICFVNNTVFRDHVIIYN